MPPRALRLATAAYPVEALATWDALADKLGRWVGEAAARGADIAVLPEYAGLEAAFAAASGTASNAEWCARAAGMAGRYAELFVRLAQERGLTLLSGSLPARAGDALVNRAFLCRPDGRMLTVDKQVLTPWERAETPLAAGRPLHALGAAEGRIAALVCYDAEFPALARALAPDVLLVPSATELPAGAARVRLAARARALEAQGVALVAPLLGSVPGCEIVDANTGRAGIYGPPDHGFASDGILAEGATDAPGWVFATVEAGLLTATRTKGAVAPRAHTDEAEAAAARIATTHEPQLGP